MSHVAFCGGVEGGTRIEVDAKLEDIVFAWYWS